MSTDRLGPLTLVLAVAAAVAAALVPGCQEQREPLASTKNEKACTACHGDPTRGAAPPTDTLGNTDPAYRGVGAHQNHLTASATHAAVECSECHIVPKATGDEGHADDALPAEVVFGTLAKTGDRSPKWHIEEDAGAKFRCSDTYCHRGSDATWTAPRASDAACGTCHGVPPAPPHPQNEACHVCHAEVIDENRVFKDPALHVNGKVEGGAKDCDSCHGSGGVAAPPKDLSGNTLVTALGVGAHRVHLGGGDVSRALACSECHAVPAKVEDPGHTDSALPAEVALVGVAQSDNRTPIWDRKAKRCADAWCHSPSKPAPSPEWTSDAGRLPCTGCHQTPPPAPHPQMTDCSRCHGAVVNDDDKTIKDRSKHVDGVVDVVVPQGCDGCHGSTTNPAPPSDLAGNTATTSPGVGAHQKHLLGSGLARKVGCGECHVVPATWDAKGHTDTAGPAELTFGGVATTGGAAPVYTTAGTCEKSYCHGDAFPGGKPSGGSLTKPKWTQVDGSQAPCGGCHALPPPFPHTTLSDCQMCHKNIDSSFKFKGPDTHVDGVATFSWP